ncbi:MAG: ATPase [Pedosphaera sp.]|nr:ATPase [Pedosphaera sp.]
MALLAVLTGNIHIGLGALGSALGVGLIGMGASSAVGRNPGAAGPILTQAIISSALAEGIIFFAIFLAKGQ